MKAPAIKLKENTIYLGDNGMSICHKCAGQSALYSGRDISGQPVMEIPPALGIANGITVCESGCTHY